MCVTDAWRRSATPHERALPRESGTTGLVLGASRWLGGLIAAVAQVGEPDEPWNFDSPLNDISQELQKDMDEKEEFLRAEAAAAAT